MKQPPNKTHNETLDPIWSRVPTADRYSIAGKRYVMVWYGAGPARRGRLTPLVEFAETVPSAPRTRPTLTR